MPAEPTLWAITSFFNPMRYRHRVANYRRFREALDVPLATIELGFDGHWDLNASDADLYVGIGDGDVLWQKERLLNLVLARLPPACTHVVWLDCDLLLPDPEWPQRLVHALADAPLVQAHSRVRYLPRDDAGESADLVADSVAARICGGQAPAAVLGQIMDRAGGAPSPGMAWAAHRELLARHGFFDACVIGGGDTALACAAYGVPEVAVRLHGMNALQQRRYLAWAEGFHRDVRGRVGSLDGEILHLWHGELSDRRASERHAGLGAHVFDPETDIAVGADGAWRWVSDKPALHDYVRDYFRRRNEDGADSG